MARLVTIHDLKEKIDNAEDIQIIDVRDPEDFEDYHIKGAVNIPLDTLPNQLAKFKGRKSVVVFCRSGARSSQAKGFLDQQGIPNVFNGGTWNNVQQLLKAS